MMTSQENQEYVIYRAGGPYGKKCARGLEYGLRAVLKTKGTVFSHTYRPSSENNIFIFFVFLVFKVGKQIYRRHSVQNFFLRIVKIRFHCLRSHQNTFS